MSHQEKIWPGSGSAASGSTPFSLYDNDPQFQQDAPRIASWCATRLGYPVQNIELLDVNFYACFEEAISEYGAQVNQFNIRNNLDKLEGRSVTEQVTHKLVEGTNLETVIELSKAYGTYAIDPVGGETDLKRGYVELKHRKQFYDLMNEAKVLDPNGTGSIDLGAAESGSRIQVTKVFYQEAPAISRFYDPYASTGTGTLNLIDQFGFGGFSPQTQFILMPLYEDLLRMQSIEFNDQIRKSAHSFNIVNNKLQVFPVPSGPRNLWFEYMVEDERRAGQVSTKGGDVYEENVDEESLIVSDYSNVPYKNIPYKRINDVGKQWIRKYTLALAKELLGAIREKYSTIPIPDSEISLDGASLRSEASQEKDQLLEQLRENLEELSRRNRMEIKNQESEYQQDMLKRIPLPIFIG